MTGFPINPPNAPLGHVNNVPVIVDPAWYRFFLAIQELLGGPSNPFEDAVLLASQARQAFDGVSDLSEALLSAPSLPGTLEDDLSPYPSGYLTRITQDEGDNRYVRQDVGASWTAPTGTLARTALASYAGQTVSNPPTQAEMQALDDAVKAMSQAVVAIITDLRANGALKD